MTLGTIASRTPSALEKEGFLRKWYMVVRTKLEEI